MKKFFIALILCVIIAATFGYSGLKLMAQGKETSAFNLQWRSKFSVYPIARNVLALHRDGDGKTDYLGSGYDSILIEVDSMQGLEVPYSMLESFAAKVSAVTGKPTKLLYSDSSIPYVAQISDPELEDIYSRYRTTTSKNNVAGLYVLLASTNDADQDLMGSTLDESGLIVYEAIAADFTKYNPDVYSAYLLSTMMHEFGHQIGLAHNLDPDCLMNEKVDQRSTLYQTSAEVISSFCPFEQDQIRQIKANIR